MECEHEDEQLRQHGDQPVKRFTGSEGLSVAVFRKTSETVPPVYTARFDKRTTNGRSFATAFPWLGDEELLRATQLLHSAD